MKPITDFFDRLNNAKMFIHQLLYDFPPFMLMPMLTLILFLWFLFIHLFFIFLRFNIPKGKAKTESVYGVTIGRITLSLVTVVRKMVDCSDIDTHLRVFTVSLCDANVKLDNLFLQCK